MTTTLAPQIVTQVDVVNNSVTRGTTVKFSSSFFDVAGNIAQPASARVQISAVSATTGIRATQSYAMSFNILLGVFEYSWDSTNSLPGPVFWTISTPQSPQPSYAGQGEFDLCANPANLGE